MNVVTIIGARPQFIKAAAISRAFARFNESVSHESSLITEHIVHTGQHYDDNMSAVFFRELEIPKPTVNLGVGSGPHGQQTGQMLIRIEEVLVSQKPDWVIVHGDTNSTLAGALAAAKLHIPVAHNEAGLRSFNRRMPEEINRLIADRVAAILFCPTRQSVENLKAEGIGVDNASVHKHADYPNKRSERLSEMNPALLQQVALVGDVMYDSVIYNMELAEMKSAIIQKLSLKPKKYGLATVHRAENTEDAKKLKSIFEALDKISSDGLSIIVPLHPRSQKILPSTGLKIKNVRIIDPLSYLDMLLLEKHARIIFTDSGGVQKEAYWMKVPCLTLRYETEWVETLQGGCNRLVGWEKESILSGFDDATADKISGFEPHYGDGNASQKIVEILRSSLN
jgi:UDP-N-acetylglucosamine 2-epimerase